MTGLTCPPPPDNGPGDFVPDGFVVLFSTTGEEITNASFEIDDQGAFWVVIADLVVQDPPARYDFFANAAALRTKVSPDSTGTILLGTVPGEKVISFQID